MPTIVGMPISRATTAECERMLPRSIEQPGDGGKERNPAGIGPLSDKDLAGQAQVLTRIDHHFDRPGHHAR